MSPVSGAISCQSSVLLSCSLGFFPQTREPGSLGTEGHPHGSRGGVGADLADSPVPGGGTCAPGSGLGPSLQGCAEWSGSPHPRPQAQPCLQPPNQRPRGGRPPTLPPVSDPPPSRTALPCPVCTSDPAAGPPSAHPQPKLGVWGWSVHLSPPADTGRGLCCLPAPGSQGARE